MRGESHASSSWQARGGNATPGAPPAVEQSLRDLILGIAPPDNESASPLTATDEGNGLVLDSFDVPSNGDSVGTGEMDIKIYARSELMTGGGAQAPAGECTTAQPDNCGKKLFEQSFHKVSDGAHLTITQSQEHRLEAEARDAFRAGCGGGSVVRNRLTHVCRERPRAGDSPELPSRAAAVSRAVRR